MLIADGIATIDLSVEVFGHHNKIYPTIIWDSSTAMLVDAGYQGQYQKIINTFSSYKIDRSLLLHLLFTHQDIDHIGGANEISKLSKGNVITYSSIEEQPYIEGKKRLLKMTEEIINRIINNLPSDCPPQRKAAIRLALEQHPNIKIDRIVKDRDELSMLGGLTIIGTPGHTPGHISIYHKKTKALIAGDCLMLDNGKLILPNEELCSDHKQAKTSLRNLLDYEIVTVICYHGGVTQGKVKQKIEKLIN